jgi:hypothetical protein
VKVWRKIERTITFTAREAYDALAKEYDLPPNPTQVNFEGMEATITIEAMDTAEQLMDVEP